MAAWNEAEVVPGTLVLIESFLPCNLASDRSADGPSVPEVGDAALRLAAVIGYVLFELDAGLLGSYARFVSRPIVLKSD